MFSLKKDFSVQISSYGIVVKERPTPLISREYTLRLKDYPEARENVREFVDLIAGEGSLNLFSNFCGRCGNCCSLLSPVLDPILQEELAVFLEIEPLNFLKRYTKEAFTWNNFERMPKRKNGSCIFLKKEKLYNITSCLIYDRRPKECRDYISNSPICQKEPSKLIKEIFRILIAPNRLFITIRGEEEVREIDCRSGSLHEETEKLLESLRRIKDEDKKDPVSQLLEETGEKMRNIIEESRTGRAEKKKMIEGIRITDKLFEKLLYSLPVDFPYPEELEEFYPEFRSLKEKYLK